MHEVSIKFLQNINDKLFKVNTLLTLCITCVQYRGREGVQYCGGVQYRGGYHDACGDLFSTVGYSVPWAIS